MATAKVSSPSSYTQFPIPNEPNSRVKTAQSSVFIASIQQPVSKWVRPWRRQRTIALFANSPEETKLRLQLEGRLRVGEHVLQIIKVGA